MFLNETISRYIGEIAGYQVGLFGSNLSAAVGILVASVVLAFFADLIFEKLSVREIVYILGPYPI
jgi:hypothetical protein